MDLKMKLNLNSYDQWRNYRKLITLGIFLAIFTGYVRGPSAKDLKIKDICGRLNADINSGEKAAKKLKIGNK